LPPSGAKLVARVLEDRLLAPRLAQRGDAARVRDLVHAAMHHLGENLTPCREKERRDSLSRHVSLHESARVALLQAEENRSCLGGRARAMRRAWAVVERRAGIDLHVERPAQPLQLV